METPNLDRKARKERTAMPNETSNEMIRTASTAIQNGISTFTKE